MSFVFKKFFDPNSVIANALDKDLGDIALMTETEIKNRTPVVTGRLKGSFVAERVKKLEHEVSTNVEYAPFVEYGTGAFSARAMMRRGAAAVQAFGTKVLSETLNLK
jgi:hypoxanthine-guanine phosphoribosyltransferase